jgi:starch synthase
VVATCVGGLPEVVVDGVTGLIVPPADPGALAGAIGTLLSDPPRAVDMGRRAGQHARERFAWDRMVDTYLGHYRALTGLAAKD